MLKIKISYLLNVLIGLPLFFLLSLLVNTLRMLKKAVIFTMTETKEAYRSNLRFHLEEEKSCKTR